MLPLFWGFKKTSPNPKTQTGLAWRLVLIYQTTRRYVPKQCQFNTNEKWKHISCQSVECNLMFTNKILI